MGYSFYIYRGEGRLRIHPKSIQKLKDKISGVEENMQYLNPPVRNVFAGFLTQVRLINPDVDAALNTMKPKIDNEVFREWCDAIAACQYDRSLKTTLTSIVSKLSDMRIVNAELEYLVFEPRKEFHYHGASCHGQHSLDVFPQ